jgi:hypothetical protein
MFICHSYPRETLYMASVAKRLVPVGIGARPIMAVLSRPGLWPTAFAAMRRLRSDHGDTPAAFLRFRQQTQRGGTGNDPMHADDLVQFLKWARGSRRSLS